MGSSKHQRHLLTEQLTLHRRTLACTSRTPPHNNNPPAQPYPVTRTRAAPDAHSQGCTFDEATQQCTGVNANDVQLLNGTQPPAATAVQQRILAIILDLSAYGAPPGATEAAVLRVGPGSCKEGLWDEYTMRVLERNFWG